MGQELPLFCKTFLFMRKISIITSFNLAVLMLSNFFLNTSTIIDALTVGHKKVSSHCYYVSYDPWNNDDGGHSDDEDRDIYDEEDGEDRENEYERENT